MIDVLELEKRYKRHQLKKNRFKIIVVIVLFSMLTSITIISVFMMKSKREKSINTPIEKKSLPSTTKEKDTTKKVETQSTPKIEKSAPEESHNAMTTASQEINHTQDLKEKRSHYSQHLEASMDFLNKIDISKSVESIQELEEDKKPQTTTPNKGRKELTEQESVVSKKEIEHELKEEQNNSLQLTKKEDKEDLQSVVKRFKKNKNPKLSLFLAKRYYNMEKYYYAYNYALITNELDNTLEDGWILFAKSLVKLNQKQKAIETLKKYIYHSNSDQAKILLDSIENGSFK